MDTELLEKAGLSKAEINVYVNLLKLGSVGAGAIIKKTGMHRQAVYDVCERLMDKGLVSFVVKANRKYFEAADPANLIQVIERQQEDLEKDKQRLQDIVPELDAMRLLSQQSQEVTLFKGAKGIKSVLENFLHVKEIWSLGGYAEDAEGLKYCLKHILPRFHSLRVKNKIPIKFVFPLKSRKRADELKGMKYTDVKVLDTEFASMTGIQIAPEFVAIIMWSQDPFAVFIRSKSIAESYQQYFAYLWKQAKPA